MGASAGVNGEFGHVDGGEFAEDDVIVGDVGVAADVVGCCGGDCAGCGYGEVISVCG